FDVFQIDDGWEVAIGDWRNNEKFPKPMKEVAEEIREAGLTPGIWTSPFITDQNAPIVSEHYEYILKDSKGEPCLFPMNDRIFYILDITNPGVISFVRQLYHMLRYDWGFLYHKLDFTRAPIIQEDAVYYDDTITLVEAYRAAVKAVRDGIGEDAYFLMCGGLFDPLIGIVNGQRIGSDVLSMWSSNIQTGGKTAPFTIKQNILRYFMNHWWDNDPDSLMVRRQDEPFRGLRLTYGLLNEEEVKTSVLNQYLGGGMICSTEPLKTIDDDRLFQLKHIIPIENIKVVPLDLFSGKRYPSLIKVQLAKQKAFQLCIINWSDEEAIPAKLTLSKEVLEDYYQYNKTYTVSEFFSGNIFRGVKCNETVEVGDIKPHGSALIKVMIEQDEPCILHSNAHFSMGEEVNKLEIVDDELVFETNYLFETPSTYIIGLPEGVTCDEKGCGYQGKGDLVEIKVEQRRKYTYKIKVCV
ncbi:MAG TPA: glycoside hydrolase family 36 protein, partial [Thermoclostridium sp.]|nr:glycoside hydrolase family 36 protein [Thermoclostridium sp.]